MNARRIFGVADLSVLFLSVCDGKHNNSLAHFNQHIFRVSILHFHDENNSACVCALKSEDIGYDVQLW
jgi:hypothetical protein